jgi:predicted GH43/DUF377 family glycosyl hydrolase
MAAGSGWAGEPGKEKSRVLDESYSKLLERLRTPHKFPELVLAPSYKKGNYDALAIDCPFVFRHKRRYYMTHVGFDGIGYRTGLASSTDLIRWEKEGLLIDRGPQGSTTEFNIAMSWIVRDNELFGEGRLKPVAERFLGTYHAYPQAGYEAGPAAIGLCHSTDLRRWRLKEPCIRASDPDAGDWERGGLYKSCLVEHEGVFYMFYNAKTTGAPWTEQTGLAISKDLKTWKRYEGNPVIPVGPKGSFDDVFCSDPCVVRSGEVWLMFFYTFSSDGKARDSVAFSKDLLHWEKSNEILIDVGPPGSVDSRYAHKPGVFVKDDKFHHFYCAVAPAANREMGDVEVDEIRGIALAVP